MRFVVPPHLVSTALVSALALIGVEAASAQEFAGRDKLFAHSNEFRRDVIQVTDGVYVAVGFALANVILVEGDDGLLIIDTTEGMGAAREVRAEFDRISTKPVRAIIYTHSHPDHVRGSRAFVGDVEPEVYAHEKQLRENLPTAVGRAGRDGGNQFGLALPAESRPNAGIGPSLVLGGGDGYMRPTRTFSGESYSFEVAGVKVVLGYAPGETDDQLFVWLPEKRTLLPGDNFYRAFPNLYAIRGVPLRRVDHWLESLSDMIALEPEYLVPSHTRPIMGRTAVDAALTGYHAGVSSVLQQTLAGMNRGLRPDELVEQVTLPPELADNPYLQEFYGTVAWSVRSIYTFHLGWFDGNATSLFPLSNRDRAARIIRLSGGEAAVLEAGRAALAAGNFQWAAELADYVLAGDNDHAEGRELKASALAELGERQISANARNYYLSTAQALRQGR